jgi:peptide chain release factor 1
LRIKKATLVTFAELLLGHRLLNFRHHAQFARCFVSQSTEGLQSVSLPSESFPPYTSSDLAPRNDAIERRLTKIVQRHAAILEQMREESASSFLSSLGKELASLSVVVTLWERRHKLEGDWSSIRELSKEADENDDSEMAAECQDEILRLSRKLAMVNDQLVDAVLSQYQQQQQQLKQQADDGCNAIIEIRAGTGGDEAALFASELLESYIKQAKALRWKVDILEQSNTTLGGIREAVFSVKGGASFQVPRVSYTENDDPSISLTDSSNLSTTVLGPYGLFQYESGGHRVQRVPVNDSRIHTSACSVAVLPLEDEDDSVDSKSLLPMSELRIETMRGSGAGGQHVNTTDSCVRITHVPTGVTATIANERSQHANKKTALALVTARVRSQQREAADKARGETRSSLLGGGDRSERIRTYNFPQDRITDHRCKHSAHGIDGLLLGSETDGLVTSFLPHLLRLQREELIEQLKDHDT